MDRRDFLKATAAVAAGALVGGPVGRLLGADAAATPPAADALPVVHMTSAITPAAVTAMYRALGREARGKVAVKLSMGEPGGHYFLAPALIKELAETVKGTFVDANTAYGGKRAATADHLRAARDHGFAAVAPVDILDADGETELPVRGGTHLKTVRVGSHFGNYDSMLVLSHFKGHQMGGFGGALKNIAIGCASRAGKCLVHTAGRSETNPFDGPDRQEHFLESMAEACEGMITAMKGQMLYISVMNNLSVDCDCNNNPKKPELPDIGVLASLDPVALDKACVDLVFAADAAQSASLRRRIEERRGAHILAHAEKLGLGRQRYTLNRLPA